MCSGHATVQLTGPSVQANNTRVIANSRVGVDPRVGARHSVPDRKPPNGRILELVAPLAPGQALDVGCGAGGLVVALAERGWDVTGIDVARTAIESADKVIKERGVTAHLEVGDARTWLPSGKFDLVTNSFALPTGAAGRAKVYAMIRSALAPGGHIVMEEFDPSMRDKTFFSGMDLPSIEELRAAFDGFDIVEAEVIETPVHDHSHKHGDGHGHGHHGHEYNIDHADHESGREPWTAILFHARAPQ